MNPSQAEFSGFPPNGLLARLDAVWRECAPLAKCTATLALWADWQAGRLDPAELALPRQVPLEPGKPSRPELVPPQHLSVRGVGSPLGRAAMLHAIAHIEFNAINLALDAVYRFAGLPEAYYAGWLEVAKEEAEHFALVRNHLLGLGYDYGDFPAHGGLWDMAVRTAADPLWRMALVPRLFEARGLDATPPIINKFRSVGDTAAVAILEVILREEVGHVALGDRWFRHLCAERGLPPEATYQQLLEEFQAPRPRRPFNVEARRAAGFSEAELAAM
ncbi:MAG: hypothetical protein RIR00_2639 [Pseudomonadota bacterium]|jgi:uncharacterized ferritin-like protein (DUF455 family)